MVEIVKLKNVEPNKYVVQYLKDLLGLALTGELTGIACALQYSDGYGGTCYCVDPNGKDEVLIAHAGALHIKIQMNIIPEDIDG